MFKLLVKILCSLLLLLSILVVYFLYQKAQKHYLAQYDLVTPVIFNIKGKEITEYEKKLFRKANPFGFIIFGYNISSERQVKKLVKDLRSIFPERKIYITIDQEGGRVDRLKKIIADPEKLVKKAVYYGDLAEKDLAKARAELYQDARFTAKILKDLDFDINFAPMADLIFFKHNIAADNQEISWAATDERSYSADPEIVTALAKEFMQAMQAEGIMVSLKHAPGIGRGFTDSHDTEAIIAASLTELQTKDFKPFRELREYTNFMMVGHATYTNLTKLPASMSPEIIDLIKNDIGFNGLLFSDALNMEALADYDYEERVNVILANNIDIIIPNYLPYIHTITAIKAIPEERLVAFNQRLQELGLLKNQQ